MPSRRTRLFKDDKEHTPTYNITIHTHGYDTKSPQELLNEIIKGVKKLDGKI
jgi:hypothetical protein